MTEREPKFQTQGVNHLALVSFFSRHRRAATVGTSSGGGSASPGCRRQRDARPGTATGIASMNHVAIDVPPDRIDDYRETGGRGRGLLVVVNHDDSEKGYARELHPGVFMRSVFFFDPDGVNLEFAAWIRSPGPQDVRHRPRAAAGVVSVPS